MGKCGNWEDPEGTEKLLNGDFAHATDLNSWTTHVYDSTNDAATGTPDGTITEVSNQAVLTQGTTVGYLVLQQALTGLTIGKSYRVRCTVAAHVGTLGIGVVGYHKAVLLFQNEDSTTEPLTVPGSSGIAMESDATFEFTHVATQTTAWIAVMSRQDTASDSLTIDDLECVEADTMPAKGTISFAENRIAWAGDATFATYFRVTGPADVDRVGYLLRKIGEMGVKVEDAGSTGFKVRAYYGTETVGNHVESAELSYDTWYHLWVVKTGLLLEVAIDQATVTSGTIPAITENSNDVTMPEVLNQNGTETIIHMEMTYFWRRALTTSDRGDIWNASAFKEFPFENGLMYGLEGMFDGNVWTELLLGHIGVANIVTPTAPATMALPATATEPDATFGGSRVVWKGDTYANLKTARFVWDRAIGEVWEIGWWAYVPTPSTSSVTVYQSMVEPSDCIFKLRTIGSTTVFFYGAESSTNATVLANAYLDKWVYYGIAYDGDSVRFYVNRSQIGSMTVGAAFAAQSQIDVLAGSTGAGDEVYMTQLRFWKRHLSSLDRAAAFNTNGLLPWPINDAGAWCTVESEVEYDTWNTAAAGETTPVVTSAYKLEGSITDEEGVKVLGFTNSVVYSATAKIGSKSARNFQGTGGYSLYRPTVAAEQLVSFAAWIRADFSSSTVAWRAAYFMHMGGSGSDFVGATVTWKDSGSTQHVSIYHHDGVVITQHLIDLPTDDVWFFVGCTRMSDGRLKMRINDQELITSITVDPLGFYQTDLFGGLSPDCYSFIDEAVVSTDEITTAEFNKMYNAGAGAAHPFA